MLHCVANGSQLLLSAFLYHSVSHLKVREKEPSLLTYCVMVIKGAEIYVVVQYTYLSGRAGSSSLLRPGPTAVN